MALPNGDAPVCSHGSSVSCALLAAFCALTSAWFCWLVFWVWAADAALLCVIVPTILEIAAIAGAIQAKAKALPFSLYACPETLHAGH